MPWIVCLTSSTTVMRKVRAELLQKTATVKHLLRNVNLRYSFRKSLSVYRVQCYVCIIRFVSLSNGVIFYSCLSTTTIGNNKRLDFGFLFGLINFTSASTR